MPPERAPQCLVDEMDRRDFLVLSRRVTVALIVGSFAAPTARLMGTNARADSVDVVSMWVGGVSSDRERAVVALAAPSSDVQLVVSRRRALTDAVGSASKTDAHVARVGVSGLAPDTRYYCAARVNGETHLAPTGTLTTAPVGAASLTFECATCRESGPSSTCSTLWMPRWT
jgi:phosphodiesterase/alkaline phosphatase D-like protein